MSLPEITLKTHLLANASPHNKTDYRRTCFNVDDFQQQARRVLPQELYEYLASGTDNQQTLQENRRAFADWYLRPRVMRPVGRVSTATQLFGRTVSMPVFCSPAGVHALCDPEGECATARAAAQAGILFALSQHATRSIEHVASATVSLPDAPPLWYQAYILKDKPRTLRLIRRALHAGYHGIFLTVDSVRFGYREADARNGFNALPPPHRLVNYDEDTNINSSEQHLEETYNSQEKQSWDQNSEQMFEQNATWDDVTWIKQEIGPNVPIVIKGIMTAEDAILAVQAGADGVMVSNHGGRQLDGALAAIDALPEVVQAVGHRVPVWMDSGVRRGTDILKALALGASAVGVGKPMFFSLAVGGQDAVSYMLQLLQTELEAAMAICGIESIHDISPSLVTRHPIWNTPNDKSRSMRSSL